MRILATGTRGFTLIELLVVVAIIGIVLALAAVNLIPSDAEVARRESGLLALSIEKARDTAWFGGRPIALTFDDGRMRQWRYAGARKWEADAAGDRTLGEVRIAALHVDGQPIPADARLIFLPDGFAVPFRLALEIRSERRAIEGDAAGAVSVVER
jgi:type II secretion system protein H